MDYFIIYPERLRRSTSLHNNIQDGLMTKRYAFTSSDGGFGDYERKSSAIDTRHLYYIQGGDGLAAVYVKNEGGADSLLL